jgi:hypothetical protein
MIPYDDGRLNLREVNGWINTLSREIIGFKDLFLSHGFSRW